MFRLFWFVVTAVLLSSVFASSIPMKFNSPIGLISLHAQFASAAPMSLIIGPLLNNCDPSVSTLYGTPSRRWP